MSLHSFDEICESQDFDHDQLFVTIDSFENVCRQRDQLRELLAEAAAILKISVEYGGMYKDQLGFLNKPEVKQLLSEDD